MKLQLPRVSEIWEINNYLRDEITNIGENIYGKCLNSKLNLFIPINSAYSCMVSSKWRRIK